MANFKFLETEYQLKKLKPKYNNLWYAGKVKGYLCIITANFYEKKCSITIGTHKEDTHKSLIEILKDEPNLKKAKITTEDATVTISYKIPFFTSSNRKKFDEIIETVISNLKRNGFSTGGFLDGTNDSTLSIVEVGQKYFYLTDSEYKKKSKDLELKKEENINKKENFILGILGVIGVALIGIIAYTLVGIAGRYVWAIPVFLTAMSFAIYKHLAGKISVISSFIIFILLAISLFIGTFLEYTWGLYDIYREEYEVPFFDVLKEAPQIILETPVIKSAFTKDLLINGGILILGFIIAFISAYKSEDRFVKIKKLDDNKM
ncbi:hypothetical protein OCK72_07770 [Fusobacterium simiae]|uniref:Uncharacterized protein n=1 Tax=Fusobacterium simiae TaxID=855 RepID=A0ABT4DIV3_FUSSI|nr:hypothetical protein [Fusobacterium simiae]MCY7008533.1 hypothetical protein [Fusobacterium simiae]